MFISKDSLIINGLNMGKYITEATYGFYDTWSSDSGYNTLSCNFNGTFKGTLLNSIYYHLIVRMDNLC